MIPVKIKIIQDIWRKLDYMVDDLKEYYGDDIDEDTSLKVRPDYGYAKFYLDWVDGSYDMSLHALIHFMLADLGGFKALLSKETYKEVKRFYKKNPEYLYDFSANEEEQALVDEVDFTLVCGVRNSLQKRGFSIQSFIDGGYDTPSLIPHISKYALVDDIVISPYEMEDDLKHYLERNSLTQEDISAIMQIMKTSGDYENSIATVLFPKYPEVAKEIFRTSMKLCKKKSECTQLMMAIKGVSNDKELIEEVIQFKEKL